MGLTPIPPDQVATVVTTLEMREPPRLGPIPPSPLRVVRWQEPSVDPYRELFRRVGERWLWYSRLALGDGELRAKLRSASAELYVAVDPTGIDVGMFELEFGAPAVAELVYFALAPELTGQGHGRWLMANALALAWRPGITRVVLNTCTLDHPSALGFYRAQGFTAITRTLETFADPRVLGLLPPDAAPQIPLLASPR